jgi:class 3 adenylate cyclase/tetratricopeptide (TPR) repeat protein
MTITIDKNKAPQAFDKGDDEMLTQLKGMGKPDLAILLDLWEKFSQKGYAGTPEIYQLLGTRIDNLGEHVIAADVFKNGLDYWSKDVRLKQLYALSLARCGAPSRANEILHSLYQDGYTDGDTLGILARTHRDLWERATDIIEKKKQLEKAFEFYYKGYDLAEKNKMVDDAIYTGTNASTTAFLLGKIELAKKLANDVRKICLDKRDDFWALASIGNSLIILRDLDNAEKYYIEMAKLARRDYSALATSLRQVRILLENLGINKYSFDHCFKIPKVVVFSGHMIDREDRPSKRFPSRIEENVRKAIADFLNEINADIIGYSSVACGSDILFLEEIQKIENSEAFVVLPYEKEQFKNDSVEIVPGGNWGERFNNVHRKATKIVIASGQRMEWGSVSYEYANKLLHGFATIKAMNLDTELIHLAVWDGHRGDGPGGTADIVNDWLRLGYSVNYIDPSDVTRKKSLEPISVSIVDRTFSDEMERKQSSGFTTKIMALLFADVKGFSNLTEKEIYLFLEHFLGMVAELLNTTPYSPIKKETWGDGFNFVFSDVKKAGLFALELCNHVVNTDWVLKGLPKDLSIRISLHAGPVYSFINPITGKLDYFGTHVNRAARIEPITPPGEVYASEEFVALAADMRLGDFRCEYVGRIPLPKKSGIIPLYIVRSSNP